MPERISPEAGMSNETLEHHLKRYEFAKQYIAGKVVLSVACGTGYGEHMFATEGGAREVIGYDISEEAIAYAQEKYSADNLQYCVGDVLNLNLPDNSIDVVVSFETIEHIEDDRAYLKELKRILKPEGIALISTPNKAKSLKNLFTKKPLNPFHVREYLQNELVSLLKEYFDEVMLFGQKEIFRRRISTLPKYFIYKALGKLKDIEVRDYDVKSYPTNKDRETAIFVTVCK